MLKKKLKWGLVPIIAGISFFALSSFVDPSETTIVKNRKVILFCIGDKTGCTNAYGNSCDTGAGTCIPNSCPANTTASLTPGPC